MMKEKQNLYPIKGNKIYTMMKRGQKSVPFISAEAKHNRTELRLN
ncbi:hypothetical protein HanIR_Chr01g0031131 [Helianthus annuus]|nr:hypothetical protein HanIR_Chr01g0031131 [Helianthus annuus]